MTKKKIGIISALGLVGVGTVLAIALPLTLCKNDKIEIKMGKWMMKKDFDKVDWNKLSSHSEAPKDGFADRADATSWLDEHITTGDLINGCLNVLGPEKAGATDESEIRINSLTVKSKKITNLDIDFHMQQGEGTAFIDINIHMYENRTKDAILSELGSMVWSTEASAVKTWWGSDDGSDVFVRNINGTEDYTSTLDFNLVEGRGWSTRTIQALKDTL